MNEMEVTQYVEAKEEKIFTTSRKVAERFGKRHSHVVSKIKKLEKHLGEPTFGPSSYVGANGKIEIEYVMNRRAFMLLALRFTGPEALQVQVKFVDAFEKMEQLIRSTYVSIDLESKRLRAIPLAQQTFHSLKETAHDFGLVGNQALLYANKATKRETGIDLQNILQIELKSENQALAFTPTQLGSRIGLSGTKFNKELLRLGLQNQTNMQWKPTEKGKPFAVILDVGKSHSDGTPVQQVKWYESILSEFFNQNQTA